MLKVDLGKAAANFCDGVSRRGFLQLGMAGLATAGLADLLRAKELSTSAGAAKKDTSVILIWLEGGPSHMDMYDMKPEAPSEYRGIWSPIKTNVPGLEISELMPEQAKVADQFSIIRSLSHGTGDHTAGQHLMLTGRMGPMGTDLAQRNPCLGAVAAKLCGSRKPGVPPFVGLPDASTGGMRPGYFGGSYLGQAFNPFDVASDPNNPAFKVQNLDLVEGMTLKRLEDRRELRRRFDRLRKEMDNQGRFEALDEFQRQAFDLVASPATRKAFDINSEDPATRDRYGRHMFGQSLLLARRLVEAGVTFTTVALPGWDMHWSLKAGLEAALPPLDRGLAALFTDLKERGLHEKTLVLMMGEFSRTYRMNDGGNGGPPGSMGTPGRDHWSAAQFALIGGGGVPGGKIVGSTTRLGDTVKDRPVSVGDLHATIYKVLGIDPSVAFTYFNGRPVPIVEAGSPINELI